MSQNNQWHYTDKAGAQAGPISTKELMELIAVNQLPLTAMAWKEGMDGWKPIGQIPDLQQKSPPPISLTSGVTAKQPLQESADVNPYEAPESVKTGSPMSYDDLYGKSYGGLRRLPYFLIPLVASFAFQILLIFVPFTTIEAADTTSLGILGAAYIFIIGLSLYVTLARFKNIGMTRWWIFGSLVPLLNIWVSVWLISRQEGWVETRQLDAPGKIVATIMWSLMILALVAMVAAIGFVFYRAN